MGVVKVLGAVVGVLVLLPLLGVVGLYLLGQATSTPTGAVAVVVVLGFLAAVAKFRLWGRRDRFNREAGSDSGLPGDSAARVRTRRDPGRERDEMTR